jgi:hypothetical protein
VAAPKWEVKMVMQRGVNFQGPDDIFGARDYANAARGKIFAARVILARLLERPKRASAR